VHDINRGAIGLPELQRPFVWSNSKIRDLFDSLYRGYPCGFLLLWETGAGLKGIGTNGKEETPSLAIVDGQQRLTSLYAVIRSSVLIILENASASLLIPSPSDLRLQMPRRLKIASHLVAVPEGVVESSAGNISVMQKRTSGLQD